jgi:hypothetical protein
MGADGCGRRAVYVLNADTRLWVLNSDRPSTEAAAEMVRRDVPLEMAITECGVGDQPITITFWA